MDTQKYINQLLTELGNKFQLNEQGLCAFKYNNQLDIILEVNEPSSRIFLYAPLLHISYLKNIRLLEELLKANYLCLETQGATFSLNNKHDIVLCYWFTPQGLNATNLQNTLKQFISVAEKWWNILKEEGIKESEVQERALEDAFALKHYGLFV